MTKNLYIVHDRLAETIVGGVLIFPADAAAVRFFGDVLDEKGTVVAKHPADHTLLHVGVIDEVTGQMTNVEPRVVITGSAYAAVTPQE